MVIRRRLPVDQLDEPAGSAQAIALYRWFKKLCTNVLPTSYFVHARLGVDKLNNAKNEKTSVQILCTVLQPPDASLLGGINTRCLQPR